MQTHGVHHGIAAWLGVLALACGRAESGQTPPIAGDVGATAIDELSAPAPSESPASNGADPGASLPSGDGAECPAPLRSSPLDDRAAWARDPATGNCCRYANQGAAPAGWLHFYDEGACKSDCLCSALNGFEGDFAALAPVRDSLECRCSLEDCPATLEEAERSLCAVTVPPAAVQRLEGCGMVVVIDRNGYSGRAWVFEPSIASGDAAPAVSRLVGAAKFSDDQSFEPCPMSNWRAGRDFFAECDDSEVVTCQLCGDSPGPEYPPCQ